MGQGGFKPGDSAWLLPDSQATAHIRSDELVGVDGTLRASLRDASGDYLEAVGAGDWSWEGGEDSVSLDGAVRVVRE